MITRGLAWFKARKDRRELLIRLHKREKEIIRLVNSVLDEMIGAEPGWHKENGRRWQIVEPLAEDIHGNPHLRMLHSPCCLTPKASHKVTVALRNAGDFTVGPIFSDLTQGYSWGLSLVV